MILAIWKGGGKRGRRAIKNGKLSLYGMTFKKRKRKILTDAFIKEAGLDQKEIASAVDLSLKTDYGLILRMKGVHTFTRGPLSKRGKEIKEELEVETSPSPEVLVEEVESEQEDQHPILTEMEEDEPKPEGESPADKDV